MLHCVLLPVIITNDEIFDAVLSGNVSDCFLAMTTTKKKQNLAVFSKLLSGVAENDSVRRLEKLKSSIKLRM